MTTLPMHQYPPPDQDSRTRPPIRTPSPTPSETKALNSTLFDWKALANWRYWIRKEWIWYYVALVIAIVLVVLMVIYNEDIMHWLRPAADWLHDVPAGWLVPIAVLFVLSFPPLFGQEIVGVLCGLVWGLGVGFAIISVGTLLGEIGNYYAFKYCCRARGEKLEKENIQYGCLAQAVRDGGVWIALVARLSAIPGHFTTAVFSTCGIRIIPFTIAAILSLPKQFITVYLGVVIEDAADGERTTKDKIISYIVVAVTLVITVWAMWYVYHKMNIARPAVIRARQLARKEKLEAAAREGAPVYTYDAPSSRDLEAGEVELHAPKPVSYNNFSDRVGALNAKGGESADENGFRTKFRWGRGSPSGVSESEPFVPQPRHDMHSPSDDQSPHSPFADPPAGMGHDRDATFHTARDHSPVRDRPL